MSGGARSIRAAQPGDATDLVAIAAGSTAPQWTAAHFLQAMAAVDPDSATARAVLVMERLGRVEGFVVVAALRAVYPGEAEIESIAVEEQCRGAGLGRLLMEAAEDWAARQPASILRLEVRAGNAPALALYRSMGFTPEGIRRDYYSNPAEDAICMVRRIVPMFHPDGGAHVG